MGLCFQTIIEDGPIMQQMEKNIQTGWIWLVGRRDPNPRPDGKGHDWHIQGTASTEIIAVEMCVDENYFVGPIPIDSALPHDRMDWPGSYFPVGQKPYSER